MQSQSQDQQVQSATQVRSLIMNCYHKQSETLDLMNWNINAQHIHAISQMNLKIVTLNLYGNRMTQQFVQQLVRINMNELRELELGSCHVDDQSFTYITDANWPQLQVLMMPSNKIKLTGVKLLQKAKWPKLMSINLYGNKIQGEGVKFLTKVQWPQLTMLNLNQNNLNLEGVSYLIENKWTKLTHLKISNNKIGDKALQLLIQADWPLLSSLDLGNNLIGDQGIRNLIKGDWPHLSELQLHQNNIKNEGLSQISKANYRLVGLFLNANKLTICGLMKLAKAQNKLLKCIDLRNNKISFYQKQGIFSTQCQVFLGNTPAFAI